MTAKEAIDHLREWWNFCDCNAKICVSKDDEALAVLTALADENAALNRRVGALDMNLCSWMDAHKEVTAELTALKVSTQFAAYEEMRVRLADALKERDALRDEVVRLQDRHTIDMMELDAASRAEDELSTLKVENERLAKETALLKRDVCSALGAFEHEGPRLAALRVKAELTALRSEADAARPLIEAAQTEPTSAAVDYLLRVVSGYAGTIKNLGQVTLDSTDLPFLESIRSLILSGPAPRVVSREWVRQRATDLDSGCENCGAESTGNPSEVGIASMLKELGIEVAP